MSVNRPRDIGLARGGKDPLEGERINLSDFADRKSVLSALMTGASILVKRGLVDPAKIAITGLSDGAASVQFARASGIPFAAASMTGCCWDDNYAGLVGPAAAREFEAMGFPKYTDNRSSFWKAFSLAPNASAIRTPLLIQSADDEYLNGLLAYTALREQKKAADLYIFPDEHHIKWQPAHRLAVYERNVAWFDFWIKRIRNTGYGRHEEVRHWADLLAEQASSGADGGHETAQ